MFQCLAFQEYFSHSYTCVGMDVNLRQEWDKITFQMFSEILFHKYSKKTILNWIWIKKQGRNCKDEEHHTTDNGDWKRKENCEVNN